MIRDISCITLLLSLIMAISVFSQDSSSYPFDEKWAEIEAGEAEGMLRSLLPAVDEIYEAAKNENRPEHVIRALLYKSKIALATDDRIDIQQDIIQDFEHEIEEAGPVEQAILQSMLAETLYNYYQSNRWTINQRTRVEGEAAEDFRFWDEPAFDRHITALYLNSLEQKERLQGEPISDWEYILEEREDAEELETARELRPFLYDLIAHRAANFFLQQPQVFFRTFASSESAAEKKDTAKNILRNLIRFHQQAGNLNAQLYNELELLKSKKNDLEQEEYLSRLASLSEEEPDAWFSADILLELAQSYHQNVNSEQPENFAARKEWSEKALAISQKIEEEYPESRVSSAAKNLAERIHAKEFAIQIEEYILPGQPNPMAVTHKNLDRLYVRIIQYRPDVGNYFNDPVYELNRAGKDAKKQLIEAYLQADAAAEFSLSLKSFDDYQNHTTIAKMPELGEGMFLVLAGNTPDFSIENDDDILKSHLLNVTSSALAFRGNQIMATNRANGQPLSGETINMYTRQGNSLVSSETLTTDDDGKTTQPDTEGNRAQTFYQIGNNDVMFSRYHTFLRDASAERTAQRHTTFITDRAIYRPGQTLYFKAILYDALPNGEREAAENQQTTIELRDANNRVISEQTLTSNEFGSVSGQFMLPAGGLTGQFSLRNENQNYWFSVEEYRRPRFEVEFDKVTELFRVEDEITAHGKASTYSGANVDQAGVSYRVYRQAIFPYLPWWRRSTLPHELEQEITSGETLTDAEGRFQISFDAVPGREKDEDQPRTYTYRVDVDVTDINGETRSGSQTITAGDRRMTLGVPLSGRINMDDFREIPVVTQNLNGEFVPAEGTIELIKLHAPGRVLRNNPLRNGDYQLYDYDEFVGYFPHDPYGREHEKQHWEHGETVLSLEFDTSDGQKIDIIPESDWEQGSYILKGVLMDGDDIIETEQLITLYQKENPRPVDSELFSVYLTEKSYQPGDTAGVVFASAAPGSTVLAELEHDGNIIKSERLALDNQARIFSFPVLDEYRGNVYVHYYFGKYNTSHGNKISVPVPYSNKELDITLNTFRDKLAPGEEEIWDLTISGSEKDRVLAEMVATMYDASLDEFRANSIHFNPYAFSNRNTLPVWNHTPYFRANSFSSTHVPAPPRLSVQNYLFDQVNWFGFHISGQRAFMVRGVSTLAAAQVEANPAVATGYDSAVSQEQVEEVKIEISGDLDLESSVEMPAEPEINIQPRRALQETAFFYPDLRTDEDGHISIRFTTPESLTEWKFLAMAHTLGMKTASIEQRVQTQKELMVIPNPPRFLREGDQVTFSARISSLSDQALSGSARLMLFDAFTMQPVDDAFGNPQESQPFSVQPGGGANVSWNLQVPENQQAVVYRIVASAGDFSDGEEAALPVLTNRMMVTETLPIHIREGQEKTFTLENLRDHQSETLSHFQLTLEMATNPVWYAIFSLPSLREAEHENSEQVFNRLFANSISQHIIRSNPNIKAVFDDWNQRGELTSRLEQNEDVKSILLEETPWVRQAESESEQMKRMALLFDLNTMRHEMSGAFNTLQSKQLPSGAFPWFDGGPENRFITTHIVSGFGHLKSMEIDVNENINGNGAGVLENAIQYLDHEMEDYYDRMMADEDAEPSLSRGMHYLYARSFHLEEYPLNPEHEEIAQYFLAESREDLFSGSLNIQAMKALVHHRFDDHSSAARILNSVKDHAVLSDEMGMYWNSNVSGWFWYQAPIETQAMLIEAFDEILGDTESVESMKVWLLKNRQTNRWHTSKATAMAVYALMATGHDWTDAEHGISVQIGNERLDLDSAEYSSQSGSGYVKTSWNREEISAEMASVEVQKNSPGVAWGALYWQYFEDLDRITQAETGIRFNKELFLKSNSETGPVLTKITENSPIQVGDLVTVRLEIQIDRDMEFVHLKDMRASGFEPVNVMSSYKFRGGLGYYESTRDAATHFFIDRMPRGVYVFEYDLRANNAGNFSNGITTLQNMYAPELSAHSEGIRVDIE